MISPGLRFGRYEVGDLVGTGGFGVVYLARDVELGRTLAIKFLKVEYLERTQVVQRFLQEARAAARIGHPGIVTVFECGQITGTGTRADGNAFIAMELLRGESLTDRLKKHGRIAPALALSIGRQLAAALAAAHEAGIIHRDLKPDNVYLLRDPAVRAGERVKIVDFGVAKLAEPADQGVHTHSQMMLGTPRYMSPEQARSAGRIDHRADIYSLGCMLFETFSGRQPYTGDLHDTLIAHQSAPVPSLRAAVPTVSVKLDRLIAAMMAKTPEARPPSMTAVDDVLASCESTARDLLDDPPPAPPDDAPTLVDPTLRDATLGGTTQVRSVPAARPNRQLPLIAALIAGGLALGGTLTYLALRGRSHHRAAAIEHDAAMIEHDAAILAVAPELPDAPAPPPDADDRTAVNTECMQLQSEEKWQDLRDCAERLARLDSAAAYPLRLRSDRELAAAPRIVELHAALAAPDLPRAKAALDQLTGSIYADQLRAKYDRAEAEAIAELARQLKTRRSRDCKDYNALLKQQADTSGKRVADEARKLVRCPAGAGVDEPAPPAPRCDFNALMGNGTEAYASGSFSIALGIFEQAVQCKPETTAMLRAFMSACKLGNRAKARQYYRRAPTQARMALSICVGNGITEDELAAP
jgi:serine/threonine protein kinase